MKGRLQIAMACLLAGALALACGSDDDDGSSGDTGSTPEGVQGAAGLCADLMLVGQSLDQVQELDSSSTIAEAQAARDALNLALTELQQAGGELTTAQNANLQDAFATFDAELDSTASGGADDSEPLGEAAAPLAASADQIAEAEAEIRSSAGCP